MACGSFPNDVSAKHECDCGAPRKNEATSAAIWLAQKNGDITNVARLVRLVEIGLPASSFAGKLMASFAAVRKVTLESRIARTI
jgi:hypothetical protein